MPPEQGLSVLHQTGNSPRGGAVSPWAAAVPLPSDSAFAGVGVDSVDGVDGVDHVDVFLPHQTESRKQVGSLLSLAGILMEAGRGVKAGGERTFPPSFYSCHPVCRAWVLLPDESLRL